MKKQHRRPRRGGFTMIELMVTMVVAGVLAGIAIPIYGSYVEHARVSEGVAKLSDIATAARAHAQMHSDALGNPVWPSADGALVDLSATENFTYAITAGGGAAATSNSLTLLATGINRMAGSTVEITITDLASNGGAPVVTLASGGGASGVGNDNNGGNGGGNNGGGNGN